MQFTKEDITNWLIAQTDITQPDVLNYLSPDRLASLDTRVEAVFANANPSIKTVDDLWNQLEVLRVVRLELTVDEMARKALLVGSTETINDPVDRMILFVAKTFKADISQDGKAVATILVAQDATNVPGSQMAARFKGKTPSEINQELHPAGAPAVFPEPNSTNTDFPTDAETEILTTCAESGGSTAASLTDRPDPAIDADNWNRSRHDRAAEAAQTIQDHGLENAFPVEPGADAVEKAKSIYAGFKALVHGYGALPNLNEYVDVKFVLDTAGRAKAQANAPDLVNPLAEAEAALDGLKTLSPESLKDFLAGGELSEEDRKTVFEAFHEDPDPNHESPVARPGRKKPRPLVVVPSTPKVVHTGLLATFPLSSPLTGRDETAALASVLTIEMWLAVPADQTASPCLLSLRQPGSATSELAIFVHSSRTGLELSFDGQLGIAADLDFTDGAAHHVVIEFASSLRAITVLFDGVKHSQFNVAGAAMAVPPFSDTALGVEADLGHQKGEHLFAGQLGGFRIWNRLLNTQTLRSLAQLTTDPITGNFNDLVATAPPGHLFAYFHFEDKANLHFFRDPAGMWMSAPHSAGIHQVEMPGVPKEHHAIYAGPTYVGVTWGGNSDWLLMTDQTPVALTDVGLQFMTFIPSTNQWVLGPEMGAPTDPGLDVQLVSTFDAASGIATSTLKFSLQPGGPAGEPGILKIGQRRFSPPPGDYVAPLVKKQPANTQTLGDLFTGQAKPSNIDLCLRGWDVRFMDAFNTQLPGTAPEATVFNWAHTPGVDPLGEKFYQVINKVAVPFGLEYESDNVTSGDMFSKVLINEQDLASSSTVKNSFQAGGGLIANVTYHSDDETNENKKKMYQGGRVITQHHTLATSHTLILDKANIALSDQTAQDGVRTGFLADVERLLAAHPSMPDPLGTILGATPGTGYGTHYANAIRFGAKGMAQYLFSSEAVSTLLESGHRVGWGIQADVSKKIKAGPLNDKINAQAGYSTDVATEALTNVQQQQDSTSQSFICIGSSGCTEDGSPQSIEHTAVPVLLDLRPISELVGPPFFAGQPAATLRAFLRSEINRILTQQLESKPPRRYFVLEVTFAPPVCTMTSGDGGPPSPIDATGRWSYTATGGVDTDLANLVAALKPTTVDQAQGVDLRKVVSVPVAAAEVKVRVSVRNIQGTLEGAEAVVTMPLALTGPTDEVPDPPDFQVVPAVVSGEMPVANIGASQFGINASISLRSLDIRSIFLDGLAPAKAAAAAG